MSNCNSCPSKGTCGKQADSCGIQNNERNKIRHVIGVMSGKGSVGKSSMSVLMAKKWPEEAFVSVSWMRISQDQVFHV